MSLKSLVVLTIQLSYADYHHVGASIVFLFMLNAPTLALASLPKLDLMLVLVWTC